MTTQSEQQLEYDLIKRLAGNGYECVMIPNIEVLTNNFRNQMNRLNAENLNGHDLTDTEFQRLSLTIEGKSAFESAKILRDKFVLDRGDGSKIHMELFKLREWETIITE